MANRSYLYSLGNRPTSYYDRPETISSLSEWAYDVPFVYRLLMSADPQLCASLVAEGLDDDEDDGDENNDEDVVEAGDQEADEGEDEDQDQDQPPRLHAISSPFAPGLERVRRFAEIVKAIATAAPAAQPAPAPIAAPPPVSLLGRLARMFSAPAPAPVEAPVQTPAPVEHLPGWLDETIAFLEENRDAFLLLETVELDMMSAAEEAELRACVEEEIERCRAVGAAFEALPADTHEAARLLRRLAVEEGAPPLDVFHGLRFDDDCDSTRTGATERPLGLTNWSEVLYFELSDREAFDAREARD